MRDFLLALLQLAVVTAKLRGSGGVRAVVVENLLLKQQLIVLRRARKRAPNLTSSDRLLCGFWSIFLSAGCVRKAALALQPSTLLAFHQALVRHKYRWLFSSTPHPKKPGPKGPSAALIQAIVELKSLVFAVVAHEAINPFHTYRRVALAALFLSFLPDVAGAFWSETNRLRTDSFQSVRRWKRAAAPVQAVQGVPTPYRFEG